MYKILWFGSLMVGLMFTNPSQVSAADTIIAEPGQKFNVYFSDSFINLEGSEYIGAYRINGLIYLKMDMLASIIRNIDFEDHGDYLELSIVDFRVPDREWDDRVEKNPEYQAVQRKVLFNGLEEYTVTAYQINDNYYYKLRDIAAITQSFMVDYDQETNTVLLQNSLQIGEWIAQMVERITLISSPTQGFVGNMITYEWTVYASGEAFAKQTNDLGEVLLERKFNVGAENAGKLIDCFYEYDYINWPDDLSSNSADGSFVYFEIEMEGGIFRKGGLNPAYEAFTSCKELMREITDLQQWYGSIEYQHTGEE